MPSPLNFILNSQTLRQLLIDAGYPDSPELGPLLELALNYDKRSITDTKYILKRIRKQFGPPPPAISLRSTPAPLSEAIQAHSEHEVDNLHKTRRKITELLHSPVIERGTLMPDACIASTETAALPVGGAIAAHQAIIPSAHSADICCSLYATFYKSEKVITEQLDHLQNVTRFGPGGRAPEDQIHDPVLDEDVWDNPFLNGLKFKATMHLADQGDGNHFASIGRLTLTAEQREILHGSEHSELAHKLGTDTWNVLVTHHGSRGLGASVFKLGQAAAIKHSHSLNPDIPDSACWLDSESEDGKTYWSALQYVARWTKTNHRLIHERFLASLDATSQTTIANEHNFVWKRGDTYLHGKGATPAWPNDDGSPRLGIIPLNMTQPILLVLGKDNTDHLSFAPHGAGRNLSRSAFIRDLRKNKRARDPKHFESLLAESTAGVEARWYSGKPDITETPIAYKDAATVRQQLEDFDLATVIGEIQPLGCLMAGQSKSWKELRAEFLSPKQKRQIQHRAERRSWKQKNWDPE